MPRPLASVLAAIAAAGAAAIALSATGGDDGSVATASRTQSVEAAGASVAVDPAASEPAPTATEVLPAVPGSRAALVRRLDALVADPEFDTRSVLAVVIRDEHGRSLVEHNAGVPVMPASTLKLVTAAAALQLEGTGGRLDTDVLVDGEVTASGALVGDLVLVAGGDPTLASEAYRRYVYPARPASHLEDLADAIVAAGVRQVLGDLVVDDLAYGEATLPQGWKDRYLSDFDGRFISGLTVDASIDLFFDPPYGVPLNEVQTEQLLDEERLALHHAPDPALEAGRSLYGLLADRGVALHGTVVRAVGPIEGEPMATLPSPRMRDILQHTVKRSDNHAADTLFRMVGAQVTGQSSWVSSDQAVRLLLGDLGVDFTGAVLNDGSGLSRDDRVTADLLAGLDVAMNQGPLGPAWRGLMSVAGVDGTLEDRLVGTLADGRFRAKTGTLTDVRAIAGSVIGPAGTRYHLAVIGNGGEVWRTNPLIDQLVLALSEDLWCDRPVVDPPADVVNGCVRG